MCLATPFLPILSAWFSWEFNIGPGPSQSDLLIFLNISPEASFIEVIHRTVGNVGTNRVSLFFPSTRFEPRKM